MQHSSLHYAYSRSVSHGDGLLMPDAWWLAPCRGLRGRVAQAVSRPARPRYIPYAITFWGVGAHLPRDHLVYVRDIWSSFVTLGLRCRNAHLVLDLSSVAGVTCVFLWCALGLTLLSLLYRVWYLSCILCLVFGPISLLSVVLCLRLLLSRYCYLSSTMCLVLVVSIIALTCIYYLS